jgi:drug/metabolite transporter (DMT)-like permease
MRQAAPEVPHIPWLGSRRRGQLCLLAVTAAWGTTFVVLGEIQRSWLPWPLMTLRFWLGTLVLLPFIDWPKLSRQAVRQGAILGALAFAGFALQTVSMRYTSEAHCAFGTSLITVFVPLLAAVTLRRQPPRSTALAMACALGGMLLLLQGSGPLDPPAGAAAVGGAGNLGDGLAVLGAAAFAAQIFLMERFARGQPLLPLLVCELCTVALLSQGMLLASGQKPPPFDLHTYALLAYLGVVASALCFLGQLYGQARAPATQAAFIYATEPLFAAALAWLLHGQAMGPLELCGGALVFFSALISEGPAARFVNRPPFAAKSL